MRRNLVLPGAALGLAGLILSCDSAGHPQGFDPSDVGVDVIRAAVETAAARQTPFIHESTPTPVGPPADHASLDLLLAAMYEGVSHDEKSEPNWRRLEPLFLPGARLTPPRPIGDPSFKALSFDEFREAVRKGMASRNEQGKPTGFYESEIGREQSVFGNVIQVFSAYEGRFRKDDPKPFIRGINSIQVVRIANDRWAIVSIVWDTERPENLIPEKMIRPGAAVSP